MSTSAPVSRATVAVQRFTVRSLEVAVLMSVEPASVHLVDSGEWLRHVLCADPVGVSGLPQRRSAQHEANVLPHVDVRRARGRRHEHHYVEQCSSRDWRCHHPR